MNATFNLKRFFLLEQYKKQETGLHLLWSAGIVLGICLLCIMYDINKGGSYYSVQTQGSELSRYTLWFLCLAPCLLETGITKHNSTLYLLLPASAFEKYLHLWIKYLIVLPLFCILLILLIKGALTLTGISYLQHFSASIHFDIIHKDQMLVYSLLQGIFFTGCFAYKQRLLIKSFAVFCLCILVSLGIIGLLASWAFPSENIHGYWMANIAAYPIYNFPVSPRAEAIIAFCNYATPVVFLLGSWISSYFLLKEKQL